MATITVEERGRVLLDRLNSAVHGLLVAELAHQVGKLVERAETDDGVTAVVLTGAHPERFVARADVRLLREGAARSPVPPTSAPATRPRPPQPHHPMTRTTTRRGVPPC